MTHLDDETLSAFIDGELDAPAADAARVHADSCVECKGRLQRMRSASAAFKRSGAAAMPEGLAARAKTAASVRTRKPVLLLAGAVASLALVLIAGVAFKMFMPTLFNNIQAMITGAASQMGSGGK